MATEHNSPKIEKIAPLGIFQEPGGEYPPEKNRENARTAPETLGKDLGTAGKPPPTASRA